VVDKTVEQGDENAGKMRQGRDANLNPLKEVCAKGGERKRGLGHTSSRRTARELGRRECRRTGFFLVDSRGGKGSSI